MAQGRNQHHAGADLTQQRLSDEWNHRQHGVNERMTASVYSSAWGGIEVINKADGHWLCPAHCIWILLFDFSPPLRYFTEQILLKMEFGERKRRRKSRSFKLVTDEGRLLDEWMQDRAETRVCVWVFVWRRVPCRGDTVNKSHGQPHSLHRF